MSNNNKEEKSFTGHDIFLSVFYLIIIAVGINLCITRGVGVTDGHLVAVTVCLFGVTVMKIAKFREDLKKHVPDIAFVAVLSVLSAFALVTTVII